MGYRAGGSWSDPDRKRLVAVILFALGAIFACFCPYAIFYLGYKNPWKIAIILCLFTPVRGLYTQYKIMQYSPEGYSITAMCFLTGLEVSVILLLLSVILGLGGNYEFGLYLSATLLTLTISAFLFYRLLETSFSKGFLKNEGTSRIESSRNLNVSPSSELVTGVDDLETSQVVHQD